MEWRNRLLVLAGVFLLAAPLPAASSSADRPGSGGSAAEEPSWFIPHWTIEGILDGRKSYFGGVEWRSGSHWRGIHPAISVSRSNQGTLLVGVGAVYNWDLNEAFRVTVGFLPSYYDRNGGKRLGRKIEFYSFGQLSYAFDSGHRIEVRFGHLSNGGIGHVNPGTEMLTIGYAIPLGS